MRWLESRGEERRREKEKATCLYKKRENKTRFIRRTSSKFFVVGVVEFDVKIQKA